MARALDFSLPPGPAWERRLVRVCLVASFLYLLLMIFTRPVPIGGDTPWYAGDIHTSLSQGWHGRAVWNFAHLIWRPIGRVLAVLFLPWVLPRFGNNVEMSIAWLLTWPNLLAAWIGGLVVLAGVARLTRRFGAALLAAVAFWCLNPLLNYSRLGTPHLCGMTCVAAACYLVIFRRGAVRGAVVWAGMLGGLAVLFWAPYLMSFPLVLLAAWIVPAQDSERPFTLVDALIVCLAGGLTALAAYSIALAELHITTIAGFQAWIHEYIPGSDRNLLRMVNGLARGFYEMGNDAVWLKWYLFHDPYAHVGVWDLLRASLGKVAMFYATLAGLVLILLTAPMGRRLLLLIAVATLPHLFVAIRYEAGSVERYAPFLPMIFWGLGYAIGSPDFRPSVRVLAAVLCCAHIPANLMAGEARNLTRVLDRDPARLAAFESIPPADWIFVLNGRDPLFQVVYGDPLNPLNEQPRAMVTGLTPPPERSREWQAEFACTAAALWDQHHQVWVTRRILADRPARAWMWVEGDAVGLNWQAFHAFFGSLDPGPETGGADGFFLLDQTQRNSGLLQGSAGPSGCTVFPVPQRQLGR